jgi:hypothetical protein
MKYANNFSVSIEQTLDNRTLKAHKPDKDGIYRGIPVCVLGKPSRNRKTYDVASVLNGITNPNSAFNIALREGSLEGEWRHPTVMPGLTKEELIVTLMLIRRELVSHYFVKVYSKTTRDQKFTIVYADLVPFGPMGEWLKASLEDPKRNTNFSMRAVVNERGDDGMGNDCRTVLALVTFDAVGSSGYGEASKRYALEGGLEGLDTSMQLLRAETEIVDHRIDLADLKQTRGLAHLIGCESLQHQELLDMLESDSLRTITSVRGMVDVGSTTMLRTASGRHDIFRLIHKGGLH